MQKSTIIKLSFVFAVSILNFWIWKVFQNNLILGILMVVSCMFSFHFFSENSFKKSIKLFVILIALNLIQIWFIKSDISFKIEDTKPEEILRQHEREYFYTQDLGKIFLNKFSLYYYYNLDLTLYKLQRNLFYLLDINQYFFASHPRERGPYEFEKYPFILLPLFVIGFFWFLFRLNLLKITYLFLIFSVSLFLNPGFYLGPILIFPLIIFLISIGGVSLFYKFKK